MSDLTGKHVVMMSGNRPVLLRDLPGIWRVTSGAVDIFVVRLQNDRIAARREFLLRLVPDQAFVALPQGLSAVPAVDEDCEVASGDGLTLMAVGGIGTQVEPLVEATDQAAAIDCWLSDLDRACRDSCDAWADVFAAPGLLTLAVDDKLVAPPGQVLWAIDRSGSLMTPEGQEIPSAGPAPPITSLAPVRAIESLTLRIVTTATLLEQDRVETALLAYHDRALLVFDRMITARNDERTAFGLRSEQATRARETEGIANLAGVGQLKTAAVIAPDTKPEWRAIAAVAHALGQEITLPADLQAIGLDDRGISGLAEACGLCCRQVILKADWWLADHGPLVAELAETNETVALLPERGGYVLWNPVSDRRDHVDSVIGSSVQPAAVMLYRRFGGGPISISGILRFALSGNRDRIAFLMGLGLLGGILGLFVPWATGTLVDSVIPRSSVRDLAFLAAGLCIVAISNAGINLVRGLLLQQMEQQVDLAAQSALFDRTMRLPVEFLKRYSVGDLANRALGLQAIRERLTGAALSGALNGIMSLMNIGMMLTFSAKLAMFGLIAAMLSFIISLMLVLRQLRRERELAASRGKSASIVLQFITGIAKLKASAAVGRAFAIWANAYARQRDHFVTVQWAVSAQSIFQQSFLPLSMVMLFYLAAGEMAVIPGTLNADVTLGLGAFLGFTAAYGQLLGGISGLVDAISSALNVVPIYERAKPLLTAEPEMMGNRNYPGVLSGQIEFSNLTFRYPNTDTPVLKDVSFSIEPGQFVAIVGPSGSGKSTVLRLLLGFESPEQGEVLYNGKPLSGLDIAGVRRQLGVVLQNGRVQPDSLMQNIGGGRNLSLDDAWDAARKAGLEEDIKAMSMGMYTMLTDGGTTLSGGQRQRLMIARALAIKPRVLLMDEATSALDNRTQAIVTDTVSRLNLTRITIAHRLSSITSVDRVIVLDRGQIVQDGPFQHLMETPGLFRDLALRQLT